MNVVIKLKVKSCGRSRWSFYPLYHMFSFIHIISLLSPSTCPYSFFVEPLILFLFPYTRPLAFYVLTFFLLQHLVVAILCLVCLPSSSGWSIISCYMSFLSFRPAPGTLVVSAAPVLPTLLPKDMTPLTIFSFSLFLLLLEHLNGLKQSR